MPAAESVRFPRTARLLTPAAFRRVFQKPVRSADACFTTLARSNNMDGARLGLAISKKHVRLAVERNRIKRQVRESFRLHRSDLPGLDVVVLGRPGLQDKSNRQLRESLLRHWRRLVGKCALS